MVRRGCGCGGLELADGGAVDSTDPTLKRLDPRSAAIEKVNRRIKQQQSVEGAQSATREITARLRGGRRVTLPHLANPGAVQYLSRTPVDTLFGYGAYPTPDQQVPRYNSGGVVAREALDERYTSPPKTREDRSPVQLKFRGLNPRLDIDVGKDRKLEIGRNLPGVPGQIGLRFEQRFADGGKVGSLIELLKSLPRSERFSALRENEMRDISKENAMWATLSSPPSPLAFYGPFPDKYLKGNRSMVPRSRQMFSMFDTTTKGDDGYALPVGDIVANWRGGWKPDDLINIQILKDRQRQGYGHEAIASLLSTVKGENDRFPLMDVQTKAKRYWEGIGAQMRDPSIPFRTKDKTKFGADGSYERTEAIRNNDFYLTPGDFLDNVDKFAEGGEVSPWAAGGLGAAAIAAALVKPRHINKAARPLMRAMSRPALGIEAVAKEPLSGEMSDARFNLARRMSGGEHADRHTHRLQGAWEGDKGMEFNPLYVQELNRIYGPLMKDREAMRYAAQMGENLEQVATPVNRFVPHLINTADDANALTVSGIDPLALRELAQQAGGDWVTAHRPGNKAMMFPLGDGSIEEMGRRLKRPGRRVRYGRSDAELDRVLLSREPLGYEDATYDALGARPRDEGYAAIEEAALKRPSLWGFGGTRRVK